LIALTRESNRRRAAAVSTHSHTHTHTRRHAYSRAPSLDRASPDVMIDASVAERAKTHPRLAADVQSLCWGE
jgi:hypothetical protein